MRLLDIGRWHVSPTLLKVALNRLEGLRMHGGRLVQGGSHGLACQVVLGWAQSPGRDNQVNPLQGLGNGVAEGGEMIPKQGDPPQFDAQRGQPGSQPGAVRIHQFAHEQLCPNGEDFGLHTCSPWVVS